MIYLASPYSHRKPSVRTQRFHYACNATASLLHAGLNVFSPIVHGHPLAAHGLPTDWFFWQAFDREQILRCTSVVVLMLDGWQESVGVQAELRIAAEASLPVQYMLPAEFMIGEFDVNDPPIVLLDCPNL